MMEFNCLGRWIIVSVGGGVLLSVSGCSSDDNAAATSAVAAVVASSSSSQATAAAPTVTLTASQTSVASGGTTTLTWSSTGATSCTASGAWSGAKSTSGSSTTGILTAASTFTISCTGVGGSANASKAITITGVAGGTCLGAGGTTWVYHDGVFSWPFDYSWGGLQLEYTDTTGNPLTPPYDIKATGPIFSGWQPASLNWSFDITGCRYLTFALKPTVANQKWHSEFLYVGDIATGVGVDLELGKYGPVPVSGQWNVYKIPLVDYFPGGVVPSSIYKFFIQDTSGNGGANNVWYIDNVGFLAN